MILSFKPQFVQPILEGTKIHTIRTDAHNRWHEGRIAQMATGVRTKQYNQFLEKPIKSIQYVFMTYTWCLEVSVGNSSYCDKYLMGNEIDLLAKNDGFQTRNDFENWFIPLIKSHKNELYSGKIIHWTDYLY